MFDRRLSFITAVTTVAAAMLMASATAQAQPGCGPLPAATGAVTDVGPDQVATLQSILDAAGPGDTIQLLDGEYLLPRTLVIRRPGVTLRSKSGNRDAVVLDGRYVVRDLLLLQHSDITIADLTLTRSYWHLVHVVPDRESISNTVLHNLRGVDASEQFIKVNPANSNHADAGVIRCSLLQLTDEGRAQVRNNCYTGGIDIHQAYGWHIAANVIEGFWCTRGLSEHAIHVWTGSRDTRIERNVIVNSARGIGLGLGSAVSGRRYDDAPCGGEPNIGHYGGMVVNNFVIANEPRLFTSSAGFDVGIGLEQSCQSSVFHNTVVSTDRPRSSSIEWRFANSSAAIANNLVSHNLKERDGGRAAVVGNIERAPLSYFTGVETADLHLTPAADQAIDRAVPLEPMLADDIDEDPRDGAADVGADEFRKPEP